MKKFAGFFIIGTICISSLQALEFKKPDKLGVGLTAGPSLLMQGYGNIFIVEGSPHGNPLSWPGYMGGGYIRIPLIPQLTLTLTGMVKVVEYGGMTDAADTLLGNMHSLLVPGTLSFLITPFTAWKVKPYLLLGAGSTYYQVNQGYRFDPVIFEAYSGTAPHGTLDSGF